MVNRTLELQLMVPPLVVPVRLDCKAGTDGIVEIKVTTMLATKTGKISRSDIQALIHTLRAVDKDLEQMAPI